MKIKLFIALCITLSLMAVLGFDRFAIDAFTFTQSRQNAEATMEKYKDVWEDRTINEAPNPYPSLNLESGKIVGTITIPKMDYYEMPIYYGSNKFNNNWQISTAGYLGNWNMFGEEGRAVVGAHNYQLFTRLPELQEGDLFLIETEQEIFIYEVLGNRIYDHLVDDWNEVAYQDSQPYSVTLMTCYPIIQGAEATQDMYMVYSKMVKGTVYK